MFLFGLFSTNVPYVILVVLYFIGYGSYSLDKLHEKYCNYQDKEKVINHTGNSVAYRTVNFCFTNQIIKKKEDKTAVFHLNPINQDNRPFFRKDFTNMVRGKLCSGSYFSVYSRPPPVS